jgi:flagellar biosynthesis/type III secretory pathway protein FliH
MLIESLEKEKQEFYEEGFEAGMEKEKIEIAKNMLLEDMEISIISKVTG